MTEPVVAVKKAVAAAKSAVTGEATSIKTKAVKLFNRFWPIAVGVSAGYALGLWHALRLVF